MIGRNRLQSVQTSADLAWRYPKITLDKMRILMASDEFSLALKGPDGSQWVLFVSFRVLMGSHGPLCVLQGTCGWVRKGSAALSVRLLHRFWRGFLGGVRD